MLVFSGILLRFHVEIFLFVSGNSLLVAGKKSRWFFKFVNNLSTIFKIGKVLAMVGAYHFWE